MLREPSPRDVTFWNFDEPSIMYAFNPGAWFPSRSRPLITAPLVLSSNPANPSPCLCRAAGTGNSGIADDSIYTEFVPLGSIVLFDHDSRYF